MGFVQRVLSVVPANLLHSRAHQRDGTTDRTLCIIVSYSGRPIPLIAFLSRGPHRIAPESPAARIGRLPKRCACGRRSAIVRSPLNWALISSPIAKPFGRWIDLRAGGLVPRGGPREFFSNAGHDCALLSAWGAVCRWRR